MVSYKGKAEVKGHYRIINGRRVYVRPHKRIVIKKYKFSPKTTNEQFRNSDIDGDGVRNVDDCRPFDVTKQDDPEEITLVKVPTPSGLPQIYRIKGALGSGPRGTLEDFFSLYPNSRIHIEGRGPEEYSSDIDSSDWD